LHYTGNRLETDSRGKVYLRKTKLEIEEPVVFMHFSGISNFNYFKSTFISRHQNRYTLLDIPQLEPILSRYVAMLEERNASIYRLLPYGYNFFDSGVRLIPAARELYSAVIHPDADRRRQAFFLERVDQTNPFDGALPSGSRSLSSSRKMNVLQWLFSGPYDLAVDLVGEEYTPELLWHVAELSVSKWEERALGSSRNELWYWFLSEYLSRMKDNSGHDFNLIAANLFVHHRNTTHLYENKKFGINLFGWSDRTVLDLRRIIFQAGIPLSYLELPTVPSQELFSEIFQCTDDFGQRRAPYLINVFVMDSLKATSQMRLPSSVLIEHYNIAFWNLDKPPMLNRMRLYDEIWVPTAFARDLIPRRDDNPHVYIIAPTAVNTLLHYDKKVFSFGAATKHMMAKLESHEFLFLVIVYKDWDSTNINGVLEAFTRCTMESTHLLVLDTPEQFKSHERLALLVARVENAHLVLEANMISRRQLLERADCLISLHRSQKFQYDSWDMLINAKPVLLTNYSGSAELIHSVYKSACDKYDIVHPCVTSSWLIPYQLKQNRATPDLDAAIAAMHSIRRDYRIHSEFAITLSKKLQEIFNSKRQTRLVQSRIVAITESRKIKANFSIMSKETHCRISKSIRSTLATPSFPHRLVHPPRLLRDTRPETISASSILHSDTGEHNFPTIVMYENFVPAVSGLLFLVFVLFAGFSPITMRRRLRTFAAASFYLFQGRRYKQ